MASFARLRACVVARHALVVALLPVALLSAPLAWSNASGFASASGNPLSDAGQTCARSNCHVPGASYDYAVRLVSFPEPAIIAAGVLSEPFALQAERQTGSPSAVRMGFALSSSSPALSLSTATLTQTDNSRVKREGVGPLNALPAFTHDRRIPAVGIDAVTLVGLRMQADVPGVYTLYYAVNLVNNADGNDGDTVVVGSMQVEVRDTPTATSVTMTLSEPASALAQPLHVVPEGSGLEYTVVDAMRGDGTALPAGVRFTPAVGMRSAAPLSLTLPVGYNYVTKLVFRVHDGPLASDLATYTVDVTPANSLPVAESADVSLLEDGEVVIELRVSDADLDPALNRDAATERLRLFLVSPPANGRLEAGGATLSGGDMLFDGGGDAQTPSMASTTVSYRPEGNFNGTDSFTWSAEDASGARIQVTSFIEVVPVDDPPVAVAVNGTVRQGRHSVDLAFVAEDFDGPFVSGMLDLDYRIVSLPGCGALSALSDPSAALAAGAVVAGADAGVRFHYAGGPTTEATRCTIQAGPFSFDYQAFHAAAGAAACLDDAQPDAAMQCSSTATARVDVTLNNPPLAVDSEEDTQEDGAALFSVSGSDVETPAAMLRVHTPTMTVSTGSVTMAGEPTVVNGAFSQPMRYVPPPDFNGVVPLRFQLRDSDDTLSTLATVSITVTPVNDPPVPNPLSDMSVMEDTPLSLSLSASDVDAVAALNTHPNAGTLQSAAIRYRLESLPTATVGRLFQVSDDDQTSLLSSVPVTLSGSRLRFEPALNFNGHYVQRWLARNLNVAGSDSELSEVRIDVTPVNDDPVAADVTVSVDEDVELLIHSLLEVSDIEGASAFRFRFSGIPEGHEIAFGPLAGQTSACQSAGQICYRPPPNFNGAVTTVQYSAQEIDDPTAASSSARLTVNVAPVNDPPEFTNEPGTSLRGDNNHLLVIADAGNRFEIVSETTFDATDVDGDELTYTITGWNTDIATLRLGGDLGVGDQFTQQQVDDGQLRLLLLRSFDESEETTASFSVSDGVASGVMVRNVVLSINNTPPELLSPPGGVMRFSVNEGSALEFSLSGYASEAEADAVGAELGHGALEAQDITQGATEANAAASIRFILHTDPDTVTGHLYLREQPSAGVDCDASAMATRLEPGVQGQDRFTQEHINRACVFYRHSGAESGATTLTLSIQDRLGALTDGGLSIAPNIKPVNDRPVSLATPSLMLAQGAALGIGAAALSHQDADDDPTALVYQVIDAPDHGALCVIDQAALCADETALLPGGIFTQQDVDNDRLHYRHAGASAEADSFEYELCDSGGNLRLEQDPVAGRICLPSVSVPVSVTADAPTLTPDDDAAQAEEYRPEGGTEIAIAVLANDRASDAAFAALRIVAVTGGVAGARVGTETREVDGVEQTVILYRPARPSPPQDRLVYTVRSPAGLTATAMVTIHVAAAADADADGLADLWEVRYGLDPARADSDADGEDDGVEDLDADGHSNLDEYHDLSLPDPGLAVQWASVPEISTNAVSVMTPLAREYVTPPVVCRSPTLNVCASGSQPVSSLTLLLPPGGLLPSGVSRLTWRATVSGAGGRSYASTRLQTVRIYPFLEFESGRVAAEGSTVHARVHISGPAPDYPVTLRLSLSGDARFGEDYRVSPATDTVTFQDQSERSVALSLYIIDDMLPEAEERIVVTLLSADNAVLEGNRRRYVVTVLEGNQPPTASLQFSQQAHRGVDAEIALGHVIFNNLGQVTARVQVEDPNVDDVHQVRWHTETPDRFSVVDLASITGEQVRFDPVGLNEDSRRVGGRLELTGALRHIGVTVTDSDQESVSVSRWFSVLNSDDYRSFDNGQPSNRDADADGNGIADSLERIADADADGIPNFVDDPALPAHAIPIARSIPTPAEIFAPVASLPGDIVLTDAGLRIAMGRTALSTSLLRGVYGIGASREALRQLVSTGAGEQALAELIADGNRLATNFLYDFVVSGLRPGAVSHIVLLLSASALTSDAEYRKYHSESGWQDFVDDGHVEGDNGTLHTAPGGGGACPPPSSLRYRPGLNPLDRCLRISIRDGGANDDDGIVNGVVVDPGGVVVPDISEDAGATAPTAPTSSSGDGSGAVAPWLALGLWAALWVSRRRRRRAGA